MEGQSGRKTPHQRRAAEKKDRVTHDAEDQCRQARQSRDYGPEKPTATRPLQGKSEQCDAGEDERDRDDRVDARNQAKLPRVGEKRYSKRGEYEQRPFEDRCETELRVGDFVPSAPCMAQRIVREISGKVLPVLTDRVCRKDGLKRNAPDRKRSHETPPCQRRQAHRERVGDGAGQERDDETRKGDRGALQRFESARAHEPEGDPHDGRRGQQQATEAQPSRQVCARDVHAHRAPTSTSNPVPPGNHATRSCSMPTSTW
ncbi:MAG TPA: hypothetical protein VJ696_07710 [Rhodanobacteraceae bacterium]|nr:hypothetical protein [Rhodanobacteraceae bacterium]